MAACWLELELVCCASAGCAIAKDKSAVRNMRFFISVSSRLGNAGRSSEYAESATLSGQRFGPAYIKTEKCPVLVRFIRSIGRDLPSEYFTPVSCALQLIFADSSVFLATSTQPRIKPRSPLFIEQARGNREVDECARLLWSYRP